MSRILICCLFLVLYGCGPQLPKGVLPPAKMQAVLWDAFRADELAAYRASTEPVFAGMEKHIAYYQQILDMHKVSKADFQKTLDYYKDHPEELKPILDSLQTFAERVQKSADTIPAKIPVSDTIRQGLPVHNIKGKKFIFDSLRKKGKIQ